MSLRIVGHNTRPFMTLAQGGTRISGMSELAAESGGLHTLQELVNRSGRIHDPFLRKTVADALATMRHEAKNHDYVTTSLQNTVTAIRSQSPQYTDADVAHFLGQLAYLDDFVYPASRAPYGAVKMTLDGVPVANEYAGYFDDFLRRVVFAAHQRYGH